ncbi:MAG: DUF116 domain-containing protein [Nitrospinae bacterium]|nr:DUF116 domain-containing protein [Nitrospinota bacterium]
MEDWELGDKWQDDEVFNQPKRLDDGKGLFLGLSTMALLIIISIILFIWYMIEPRLLEINHNLPTIIGIIIGIFIIAWVVEYLLIVLSAITERNLFPFRIKNGRWIAPLFALSLRIGRLFGISKDRISNSFVKVNNALVKSRKEGIDNEALLILLPRCLQNFKCKQRVVEDIDNCKDCGQCIITQFKSFRERYKFKINVVTGGNLARRIICRLKPSAILAVACERELVSGIEDIGFISVIGIANYRPEGPCKNTMVDMEEVEKTIKFLFNKKDIFVEEELADDKKHDRVRLFRAGRR